MRLCFNSRQVAALAGFCNVSCVIPACARRGLLSPLWQLSLEGSPGAPWGGSCDLAILSRVRWGAPKPPEECLKLGMGAGMSAAAAGEEGSRRHMVWGGGLIRKTLLSSHGPPAHTSAISYHWGQQPFPPPGLLHPASPGPPGKCNSRHPSWYRGP